MHVHFERPCNKLKNVTTKLKILKSKLENLKKKKKIKKPPHFMSEFQFYISFQILTLRF